MFENILHAPLQRHKGASQAAHSLLEGLLERDVSRRLGGNRDLVSENNDAQHNTMTGWHLTWACFQVELQEHAFFESINWTDLLARKVSPPFTPKVVRVTLKRKDNSCYTHLTAHSVYFIPCLLFQTGPCDVSYIDPEFTLQPVPASLNERCQDCATSDTFQGFSFMNPLEHVVS